VLTQALGQLGVDAEIKRTESHDLQGKLDLRASGSLGLKVLAKAKLDGGFEGSLAKGEDVEMQPVGRTPGDVSWVARVLNASERRLVVEDFHYLSEANQRAFSFLLKALGEYGVYVIVVGIWPQDHLLTYYNGDLDGRVEDITLYW
jgi:hypothetical protein